MHIEQADILCSYSIHEDSIMCECDSCFGIWIYIISTWAHVHHSGISYISRIWTWHCDLDHEAKFLIGGYLEVVLIYIFVHELAHQTKYPQWNIHIHLHLRDRKFATCKDTIFATYGSAGGDMSSFAALVSETEASVCISSIDEWFSRELIPVSTWENSILYVRLNYGSVDAIGNRSDHSSFLLSLDLKWSICVNSQIEVIGWSRSDEAIVDPLIYAYACRYREYHWQSHAEWALIGQECSHPCDRVCCIGEGELNLLLIGLEVCEINMIPFSITWSESNASVPIKLVCIVTAKCVAVSNIYAEHDWLIGCYLNVVLSHILVHQFIYKESCKLGESHGKVKPCRYCYCTSGQDTIVTTYSSTQGDVSSLIAIVYKGNLWEEAQLVEQCVRYAIPLGSTRLLRIGHTLGDSRSSLTCCRIYECRCLGSSKLYLCIHIE